MLKYSSDGASVEVAFRVASCKGTPPRATRVRRSGGWVAALALGICLLGPATPASAIDEYDAQEAGHPLRIAAYVVHPIGVMLDYMIMRPAYWVGSHEPFRTLFGRTD